MEKRIDVFERKLDKLLKEFSDISYEELSESLDFYASRMLEKAQRVEVDD